MDNTGNQKELDGNTIPPTHQIGRDYKKLLLQSLALLLLMIIVSAWSYFLGSKQGKNLATNSLNTANISPTATPVKTSNNQDERFKYPSAEFSYFGPITAPNGKYVFTLDTEDKPRDLCKYTIQDTETKSFIVPPNYPDSITCEFFGPVDVYSSFITLTDEGIMLIGDIPGLINSVDITNGSQSSYEYDYKKYRLQGVSNDLKKWVYSDIRAENTVVIQDDDFNTLKTYTPKGELSRVYIDSVNDGFLVVSSTSDIPGVSFIFDYIDAKSLNTRNLLTTDFKDVGPGSDCGGDSFISIRGELIIKPGCIQVNPKYLSSDKKIHLKL